MINLIHHHVSYLCFITALSRQRHDTRYPHTGPEMTLKQLIRWGAVILLGMMIAEMLNRESSCETDLDILHGNTSLTPCRFFSETYQEARSKFRNASAEAGAELFTLPVVNDYTMDIAVLKGNLPGVVVHTSGFHGVEGYAGSAIQVAWLSLHENAEDRPSVVLVHAVNPYGMAHYRRTNENNVDLNRNGLHESEWPLALGRDPNIANYQDFDPFFNPPRPPTPWYRYVGVWWDAARVVYVNGLPALKRAMVTGQYHNAKGIFYGGRTLQPSLGILYDFLQKHVPKLKKGPVTMVNVHTGLGRSGEDTLLTLDSSGITPLKLQDTFGGSLIPGQAQSADNVAAGYDLVMGTAEGFFAKLFKKSNDWIVTQEFGTVPSIFVGVSLILENMARQYLPEAQAEEWTLLTRSAFYKRTELWRRDVLVRGLRVLQQAIARS